MTPSPPDAPASRRLLAGAAGFFLAVVLVVNVPPMLRTAMDCDPILFDLYVRDVHRGGVMYRDMVENNTPTMIGIHAMVRYAFGNSTEALRIVDLAVVGFAIGLLARWFHSGRSDLRLLVLALMATLYLNTIEWNHVQRDVWLLLPVMAGLYFRRSQLGRLTGGRWAFGWAMVEGIVWGLAVWLKPYAIVIAAPVWFVGVAWARSHGASARGILADAAGLFVGGILAGATGVGIMDAFGIWRPYLDHLSGWAIEYRHADIYGAQGPWFYRLGYAIRNAPWSLLYIAATPAAVAIAARPVLRCFKRVQSSNPSTDRPDRVLLATALAAWAFQAWCLQHVFDYTHIGGELLAVALAFDVACGLSTPGFRRMGLIGLVALTAAGHIGLFCKRITVWRECTRSESTPDLRDKLSRYQRVGWAELDRVDTYLKARNAQQGEVNVVSDTALPLWEMLGHTPPVRYYIVQNNLLAFHGHRNQILSALSGVPNQRFLVCDITALRWTSPPGWNSQNLDSHPLPDDWHGLHHWSDRIVFRAGRYVVLEIPASDIPVWMADVSEF